MPSDVDPLSPVMLAPPVFGPFYDGSSTFWLPPSTGGLVSPTTPDSGYIANNFSFSSTTETQGQNEAGNVSSSSSNTDKEAKSSSSPLPSAPTSPSGSKTTTSGEQPPTFAPAGDTWNASNNLLVWPPPLTTGFEASDNQVAFVCDPLTNQVTTMMLIAPMMHQQPPFTAFPPPNTMPDVTSSRMDVLADGSGDSGCQALSQQMKEDHDDGVVALQQSMNDLDLNTSNTSNDCRGSSGVCGSGPGHHRRPLFNRSSQFGDRQRRASVNFTGAPNKSDDQVRFKISPFVSGRESLRRLPTGFPDPRIMARRKPFIRRTFGTRHYVRSSTGPSPTGGSGVGNQQQHPHDVSNRLHPLEEGRYQADGHTIAKTSPEE